MRRSAVRFFGFIVLVLLGAPVAMHFVIHDLHHGVERHHPDAYTSGHHGDHEHPVMSSPAPQLPVIKRSAIAVAAEILPATWTRVAATRRNVIAHGALRLEHDVGLQPLLSTFLI